MLSEFFGQSTGCCFFSLASLTTAHASSFRRQDREGAPSAVSELTQPKRGALQEDVLAEATDSIPDSGSAAVLVGDLPASRFGERFPKHLRIRFLNVI